MAQINMVRPRDPDRKEREPSVMDQILQGLQIANSVYGLKAQYDKGAEDSRIKSGEYTPAEIMDIEKTHNVTTEPPKDSRYTEIKNTADGSKLYASVRQMKSPAQRVDTIDEQGNPITKFVAGQAGESYMLGAKPKQKDMVSIDTINGKGERVTKRVPADEAGEWTKPPAELSPAASAARERGFQAAMEKYSTKSEPIHKQFNAIGDVEREFGKAMGFANPQDFKLENFDSDKGTYRLIDDGGNVREVPLADLPGVSAGGRWSFFNGDARKLQSAMAKVFNVELKDRSGAAVTSNELERLRTEFESGAFNTEAEMVDAMKRYKAAAASLLNNIEAPYRGMTDFEGRSVVDRLEEYGGFTSRQFDTRKAGGNPFGGGKQNKAPPPSFTIEELEAEAQRRRGGR